MDADKIIGSTGIHSIIKNQNGEFLVLKRVENDENDPGLWDLSGGTINQNENITDALKREVKEETNLSIEKINLIGAYTCDEGKLQLCAFSEFNDGELKLSREHTDFKWLSEEEFLNLKPAGVHLLAGQYFLQTGKKVTTYDELMSKS